MGRALPLLLRAGTEGVAVGQVRWHRVLVNDDRHRRIRRRFRSVANHHLVPVLVLRGSRLRARQDADRDRAADDRGDQGRSKQTSQPSTVVPWRGGERRRYYTLDR